MNARKKTCLLGALIASSILVLCTWGVESSVDTDTSGQGGEIPSVDDDFLTDPVATIFNEWMEICDVMEGEKDVIESQLDRAYAEMPELARHYQASKVYIEFLQHLLLERSLELPTSDLPVLPPLHWPSWFCESINAERFMCKCLMATNDLKHCLLLDLQRHGIPLGEDETIPGSLCGSLLQDYKDALSCQLEILEKDNPTEEDWQRFAQCKKDADRNWSAYVLRGCFTVQTTP